MHFALEVDRNEPPSSEFLFPTFKRQISLCMTRIRARGGILDSFPTTQKINFLKSEIINSRLDPFNFENMTFLTDIILRKQ